MVLEVHMTKNQLTFQSNLELARANRAREYETARSNQANEAESVRSHKADEAERYRSNQAKEGENLRHNKRQEFISGIGAGAQYLSGFGKLFSGASGLAKVIS